MRVNNNPWIENTGTVPHGVGPDTVIEVEYRYGGVIKWDENGSPSNNDPTIWTIEGSKLDVIRWRLV